MSRNADATGMGRTTAGVDAGYPFTGKHRWTLATVAGLALELVAGYKLPEPVRLADRYVDEVKAGLVGG